MKMKIVTIDNLQQAIGEDIGISDWYDVTQADVNTFADVTRDHQFIHVDPENAAKTPFGGTIAHGFLSLSMLSFFAENGSGIWIEGGTMGVNYGFDKVRFIHPVRVGTRIRAHTKLISAEQKSPQQVLFKQEVIIEIDGIDKPALVAEWLTMAMLPA